VQCRNARSIDPATCQQARSASQVRMHDVGLPGQELAFEAAPGQPVRRDFDDADARIQVVENARAAAVAMIATDYQ
jgi:hypothetical protein